MSKGRGCLFGFILSLHVPDLSRRRRRQPLLNTLSLSLYHGFDVSGACDISNRRRLLRDRLSDDANMSKDENIEFKS